MENIEMTFGLIFFMEYNQLVMIIFSFKLVRKTKNIYYSLLKKNQNKSIKKILSK